MSWPLISLPEICCPRQWPTIPKNKMLESGFPVYGANGKIGYFSSYNHESPTVLITCRGATCGKINVCDPKSYVTGNSMALDNLDTSRVDMRFLVRILESADFSDVITGMAQPQITRHTLARLQFPLPHLAEQKRIAAILDAADILRAKRREAIAQLDALLQSTFLEMFGDPVTNPLGWKTSAFNELGKFFSGGTPSKSCKEFWEGSTPWVSPKDMKVSRITDALTHVSTSAFEETNLRLLNPQHLLIVVRGMILAHSFPLAINLVPVAINQDMKAIWPSDQFNVLFLAECVRYMKRQILSEVSTAAHGTKRFDGEAMRRVRVPIPTIDLQHRFANIVESVEQQKARMQAHLAELDALFASLQHRAFNGEL